MQRHAATCSHVGMPSPVHTRTHTHTHTHTCAHTGERTNTRTHTDARLIKSARLRPPQAETLSALLGATALGDALRAAFPGGPAFVALASAIVVPTVLLPDLASLSSLGALSVGSAVAIGLTLAALWFGGAAGAKAAATRLLAPDTLPQVLGCVAFVYAGERAGARTLVCANSK